MLFFKLDGIPEPPEGYVPPLGSSRNTWTNIYKNKGRIDYCVQQFGVSYLVVFFMARLWGGRTGCGGCRTTDERTA
jgi:hypothetical protein